MGYRGHKPQKGETVLALSDTHGYGLAPLTGAPGNEVAMGLLPQGLKDLKRVAREGGVELHGAGRNLEAGFARKANRKAVFKAGLKPNLKLDFGHIWIAEGRGSL
jgi:hypothetical protein